MAILLTVVITFVFLVGAGWVLARVMNFEVKQAKKMPGFSRFLQYEDQDHPPEQ
ncbi:MAG TPA: hypothetical protein VK821_04445 [Dehalococcoidia bacterium]|nr:hypothetical protein [Dehalococcoidia bacterium]